MAQLLAFRAVRGDATALESLERDADSGVASAETGLAEYYYRMRSKLGPSYSVDMILDVTSTFNNSAKHAMDWALERDRRSPQSSLAQQDEYTRKIHRLLKDAASKNDAAAMGALGQAIVVEFWNLEITTERMGLKLADDSGTVAAARQLCPQAKSMLEAADEAGWAPAAAQLGLMHGSNAPDTLLVATGCMFPTNIRQSDKYFERSAEEGDPASLKMMVIQMQKAGNAVATEKWLRRLKAITQYGDPDAAAVLRALGRS